MKTTNLLALTIFAVVIPLLPACSKTSARVEALRVEYGKVCTLENNGKTVAAEGYLSLGTTSFCSGRGGDVTCRLAFKERPDSATPLSVSVSVGTGASQMEELPRSYQPGDLKLRADDESLISPQDRVRVYGDLLSAKADVPGGVSCSLSVEKIERVR